MRTPPRCNHNSRETHEVGGPRGSALSQLSPLTGTGTAASRCTPTPTPTPTTYRDVELEQVLDATKARPGPEVQELVHVDVGSPRVPALVGRQEVVHYRALHHVGHVDVDDHHLGVVGEH